MSFLKSTLLATAAALISTSAFAADPVADYTSDTFNWEGFYVGLSGGGLNDGTSYVGVGGLVGGNVVSGDFVLGAEFSGTAYYNGGTYAGTLFDVTARAGTLIDPNSLLYISGGATFNDVGTSFGNVGGGLEYALNANATIGIEYSYITNGSASGHIFDAKFRWYMR